MKDLLNPEPEQLDLGYQNLLSNTITSLARVCENP
jgi:hypothetical protein